MLVHNQEMIQNFSGKINQNNMLDLNQEYTILYRKVIENYTFFVPYELLQHKEIQDVLSYMGIKLNEEFIEKYVDKMLYTDINTDVHELKSFQSIVDFNMDKHFNLQQNCCRLANLKDTIGNTSFNYVLDKYVEQVVILNLACDKLIEFYHMFYEQPIDPTFLFKQQKVLLQGHLNDIETIIGENGNATNPEEISRKLAKSFFALHGVTEDMEEIDEKDSNKDKKNIEKATTVHTFKDVIKHEKKEAIELIVKNQFSDYRGVSLRYLIEFFVEYGLLIIQYKEQQKIYNSLKLLLGDNIGSYNGIFNIPNFSTSNVKYKNSKNGFKIIFEDFI